MFYIVIIDIVFFFICVCYGGLLGFCFYVFITTAWLTAYSFLSSARGKPSICARLRCLAASLRKRI